MNPSLRLQQFADTVKAAGLEGKSMTAKLAELVETNDFTPHEIERIAEMANRGVQLALYKVAEDKRFKFELCDPVPLKAAARKHAESQFAGTGATKVAEAELSGDPFKLPGKNRIDELSIMQQPLDEEIVLQSKLAEIDMKLVELDKLRIEYESTKKEGALTEHEAHQQAQARMSSMVQAAMDMLMTGITLPSLYEAVLAGVEGTHAMPGEREAADMLMALIITEIKKRGMPNHKMGFRSLGHPADLDKLTAEDLLERCRFIFHTQHPERDLDQRDRQKYAAYSEEHKVKTGPAPKEGPRALLTESEEWLSKRPSAAGFKDQTYLDEAETNNIPPKGIRVINGQNEFVIGVKDLVGTQARVWRARNAAEYLGLKLKEIESILTDLTKAKREVNGVLEKRAEERKQALLPLLGAVAGGIGRAALGGLGRLAGGAVAGASNMIHPTPGAPVGPSATPTSSAAG